MTDILNSDKKDIDEDLLSPKNDEELLSSKDDDDISSVKDDENLLSRKDDEDLLTFNDNELKENKQLNIEYGVSEEQNKNTKVKDSIIIIYEGNSSYNEGSSSHNEGNSSHNEGSSSYNEEEKNEQQYENSYDSDLGFVGKSFFKDVDDIFGVDILYTDDNSDDKIIDEKKEEDRYFDDIIHNKKEDRCIDDSIHNKKEDRYFDDSIYNKEEIDMNYKSTHINSDHDDRLKKYPLLTWLLDNIEEKPNTTRLTILGLIISVLFLKIGFWKTILIIVFTLGFNFAGRVMDKEPSALDKKRFLDNEAYILRERIKNLWRK